MKKALAVALVLFLPAGVLAARAETHRPSARVQSRQVPDLENRDIQIAVWKKALTLDSMSAISLGQLAGLYMQRGRESGDESNYAQAEEYARRSLAIRENRNGAAFVTLASALLAQHKFLEADTIAERLVALEPDIPQYRSMRGEIELELGRYDDARADFTMLWNQRTHLSISPRLARWLELTGRPDDARRLLSASLDDAKRRRDLPREQVAWFYLRVGDLDLRYGRPRSARTAFLAGLSMVPEDYRLLAAMARLDASEGDPRGAIEYGERAMTVKLDPATLGTIGDAYAAIGDSSTAEDYFKTMEVAVAGQPGAYHRAWSLFLLDHDRRVSEVLRNVRAELESRKDIYGYDLLAWALHKSGRDAEALGAIRRAMRLGTEDPSLFFHAGMIDSALGDSAGAKRNFERALSINPHFHPSEADEARRFVAGMTRNE